MSKEMTIRQARFVAAYLSGKSAVQAAIEAGYAQNSARTRGYNLLNESENVKRAVAEGRKRLCESAGYGAETALKELNEEIQGAVNRGQFLAVTRLMKLKFQLCGLLERSGRGEGARGTDDFLFDR